MGTFLDVTASTYRYFSPEGTTADNLNTEEGSNTLANYAAFATTRNVESDEDFVSLQARYKERIDRGDLPGVRDQIDDVARVNELDRIRETQLEFVRGKVPGATGEDLEGLLMMESELSGRPRNDYQMEHEAVSQMQEEGIVYPEQESFYTDEGKYDILNAARQNTVFMTIFADKLDQLRKENETIGFDYSEFIPFDELITVYGAIDKPKGSSHLELPGTRIQNLSNDLWGSKSTKEFADKLDKMILQYKTAGTKPGSKSAEDKAKLPANKDLINLLTQIYGPTENQKFGINAVAAADVLLSVPVFTPFKVARNPAQLLNAVGNRSGGVDVAVTALAKEAMGDVPTAPMSPVQAVGEAIPTGLYPTKSDRLGAGMSGEINRRLAKTQAKIDAIEVTRQRRLEPEQEAEALRQAEEDAEKLFGRDNILDYDTTFDEKSGLHTSHIYLGDEYGLPFSSKEAALESAERRGLIGTPEAKKDWVVKDLVKEPWNEMGGGPVFVEQNAGTGWTLKISRPVREDGVLPPTIPTKDWGGGSLTEKFRNPAHFLPNLIHADRVSADLRSSRLAAKVIRPLVKKITGIGEGAHVISRVIASNPRFLDENSFETEFLRHGNRTPTNKEKEAYYSGIQLNNLEHQFRNEYMHEQKSARGMLTVSIDTPEFQMAPRNGREIVYGPGTWNSDIIYDVEKTQRTVPGNNTKRYKDRWESGNYRLLKIEDSISAPDGKRAKIIFIPKASSKVGPLTRNQLPYREEFHRNYSNRFFAKQAVVERLDDGTPIFHNPLTHIVGREGEVSKYVEKMEIARKAWNDMLDHTNPSHNLRKVIDDVFPGGYTKWKEAIEAGEISPDTPFESVFDKGMPTHYNTLAGSKIDWRDVDLSDVEQHALTHKQMYYSEKGEHLLGADGNLAEVLDPYQTMSLATNNVIYLKSFAAYNDKAVKEWARAAEPYLDRKYHSAWDAFSNGELQAMDNTPELRQLRDGLTAAKANIQRFMNFNRPGDAKLNQTRAKIARWFEGKGKKGDQIATHLLRTDRGNPVNFLQRATFISAFFADASQIVIQPMTALAATTIHPVHGLRSWLMSPYTMLAYFNRAPNFVDYVAKAAKAAGAIDDVADYKLMVKTLQNSGWLNVGKEMAELGMMENGFMRSAVGNAGKELERYGTSLVRVAEGINRLTAFQIAWRDTRKQFPNAKPDSAEFSRYLTQKADDLSWNMTRASQHAWQKGGWGLATRFQSYNANMLQNMLPAKMGGNPRWSPEQRARLVLGQWLLFGAAGIPGAHLISEGIETMYQQNTGKPMDQDMKRAMTRGGLDSWLYGATGADVDFAARAGVGSAVKQLMQSVSEGSFEKSALELAIGPPGRVGNSMLETVSTVLEYFRYEQVENLGREDFYLGLSTLSKNFAAFSRYEAAYWAYKTNFLLDPRTHQQIVGVNDAEKVFIALGIQPFEVGERYAAILDDDAKSKMAFTVAGQLVKIRRDAILSLEEGDVEMQRAINLQAGTLMAPFRDDPYMTKAITQAVSTLEGDSGTLYEEAIQRLYTKWGTPLPINKELD